MNEQARKKTKLSQRAGRASAAPWTVAAIRPTAATAPAATLRESSIAPSAMPTVQIESIAP